MFTFDHAPSSDRAWLSDATGDCRGFYFSYGPTAADGRGAYVLARVYDRVTPGSRSLATTNSRERICTTVADARAWMLSTLGVTFVECDGCGHFHQSTFAGDCPQDPEPFADLPHTAVVVPSA